ncbi:MAG: uroporphyrinogen decarboxylase family protein [Candidatus Latescibacterota bacterium]
MRHGKEKPLIQWMKDGDPEKVPVMMADIRSTVSSWTGVPLRMAGKSASFSSQEESPITEEMILACSRETGIHFVASLGSVTPMDVIAFMDDIEMTHRETVGSNGEIARETTIRTPAGDLSDIFVTPSGEPSYWQDHFVKTEADLPALAYLIEKSARACLEDDRVRMGITERFRTEAEKWPAHVPLWAIIGVPAFILSSNLFVDPTTAFYVLADHRALMERLYESYELSNSVWVACAEEAGADFIFGAINGLELFSPEIFRKYFVPQARRLFDLSHERGMRGWVHTCGHMDRLIHTGAYSAMQVDVLESFSHPPPGDLTDLRRAREKLGEAMVTRGGVNVSLFYEGCSKSIRERVRTVLGETRGYRHMIGDTNDSFPPYPRESIRVLVDEAQQSGRMLRA